MATETKLNVKIAYDGSGWQQLTRDAQRAEREMQRVTRNQIQAQRTLQRLTRSLDRGLAQDAAGRQPSFSQQVGRQVAGQFIAANIAIGGAQAAIQATTDFTKSSLEAAMAAERLESATNNLGQRFGVSGKQITDSIQEASLHTINETDAMQAANQAMLLGVVKSEEEFAELARLGIVLGRAMGQDAKKSIEDITIGIGRQSRLILDNLGIMVSAEKANENYARSLGITVSELTDAQKAEAFRQEVLKQGRAKVAELGDVTLDSAGKVEQLTARWRDFQAAFGASLLQLGSGTGLIEKLSEGLGGATDALEGFNDASKALDIVEEKARDKLDPSLHKTIDTLDTLKAVTNPLAFAFEKVATYLGTAAFNADGLQAAYDELEAATTDATDATDDNTAALEQSEEALKRLEHVRKVQQDSLVSIKDIQAQALEDTGQAWQDWSEDVSKLNTATWQNLEKIQADSAKRQKQIQAGLQKDLAGVDKDLAKDLEKIRKENAKRDTRAAEDAAREQRREERRAKIDTLADERLFQNELKWLAADGQAIAIQQALERRAIEQQIAAERSSEQQQAEEEDRQIRTRRQQEDDAERIRELRDTAAERKAELEARAAEEMALEQQRLAESIDAENAAYEERKAALDQYLDNKLVDIENNSQEAIQQLARELALAQDLTEEELGKLAAAAGRLGKEAGAAFAFGLKEGAELIKEVSGLLGQGAGGGTPTTTGRGSSRGIMPERDIPGFAGGGFVPGPIGAPRLILAHGGEEIRTPEQQRGQVILNVNGPSQESFTAYLMAGVEKLIQDYDDQLASRLN